MSALPLSDQISQASQGSVEYKVIMSKYGNGYSQRAVDGINNKLSTWEVSWENMTAADAATIKSALDSAGGVTYMTWTPPLESTSKKFIAKTFSVTSTGVYYTISASLEEVADL